jgi:hypothetical protein
MAIDQQYVFDSLIINGGDSSYILDSLGVRGMPLKTRDFDGPFYNKTYEGCTYFVEFAPRYDVYDISLDNKDRTYFGFYTLIEDGSCTLSFSGSAKRRCDPPVNDPFCLGLRLYTMRAIDNRSKYYKVRIEESKLYFISKPGPVLSTFVFRKR